MNRIVLFTSTRDDKGDLLREIQQCCHKQHRTFDHKDGVITIPALQAQGADHWKLAIIWEHHNTAEEYETWLRTQQPQLAPEAGEKGPVAVFCHGNTDQEIRKVQRNFVTKLNISDSTPLFRTYSHGGGVFYNRLAEVLKARNEQEKFSERFKELWRILLGDEAYQIAMEIAAAYLPTFLAHSLSVPHLINPPPTDMFQSQIIRLMEVKLGNTDKDTLDDLIAELSNSQCVTQTFPKLIEKLQPAYTCPK